MGIKNTKTIKKIRTATFFENTIFYLKGNEIIATKPIEPLLLSENIKDLKK